MSMKVTIWLTDSQAAVLTEAAEKEGLRPHELGTLILLKALGFKVKDNLRKAMKKQELKSRDEYLSKGNSTTAKVRHLLENSLRPLSTTEIRKGLGWKAVGGLADILKAAPEFELVPRPEHLPKARGRTPYYWQLTSQ